MELQNLINLLGKLPLIIAIIILLIILPLIYIIERKIKKRIDSKNKSPFAHYKKEIKAMLSSKKSLELLFNSLDNTARNYFNEAFNLPRTLEYSELESEFKKNNQAECALFCKNMIKLSYSGENINKKELLTLTKLLLETIEKNKGESQKSKNQVKSKISTKSF